jgi:hypothetical protein
MLQQSPVILAGAASPVQSGTRCLASFPFEIVLFARPSQAVPAARSAYFIHTEVN